MTRGKRTLTDEEKMLWQQIKKTVTPLSVPMSKEPAAVAPQRVRKVMTTPSVTLPPGRTSVAQGDYAGIDRNTAQRFRKGKYRIDGTLDLHGLNKQKAHIACAQFISGHFSAGSRCVLVITGKGKADNPGLLRTLLPQWLDMLELRPMILAFDAARPHHGGEGAFYILLKRKRP